MLPEEELRARAVLAEMQMRVSQGPYAALGVHASARAEDVRAAFLALTKRFHPARFGRMSPEVHKLANEVFLGIKTAHDQLIKQLGSSGRAPTSSTTAVLRVSESKGYTVRGTGLGQRPTGTQPGLARGTERAPSRPSPARGTPSASATPSSGISRPITSRMRSPSAGPATGPYPRVDTPSRGIPVQRPSTPSLDPARRATPGTGTSPSHRPASPSQRPTSPYGAPRPGTPRPVTSVRRPTTPGMDALNPPTIRYSGVQPTQPLLRNAAFDEQGELDRALGLLSSKQWTAARQALHALASKVPQSKRYRSLLCYARGRETQASGRNDDAVLEFQRALQLDPDLEIARQALRELGRKSRF